MVARRVLLIVATLALFGTSAASAQTLRPSDPPVVFADNEAWYVSQEPLAVAGGIFHPSGPTIHFVAGEMVPSATFERVTIYTRTTVEPGSMIYVPLQGGLMRPYERLRSGELAGTVGSLSPNYPVVHPSEPAARSGFAQTPALDAGPVGTSGFVIARAAYPAPAVDTLAGRTMTSSNPAAVFPAHPLLETAQRPVGLNGVYVEFSDARWFADGPAVTFEADRFTRVGEYRAFGVYREKDRPERIYIALFQGQPGLMSPYKQR